MLVDNTIGRIFRNVAAVNQATPASVIAGAKLVNKAVTSSATLKVTNNLGNRGIFFIGGGLATQFIVRVASAPRGSSIVIRARRGTSYDTSTEIGTYELVPTGSKTLQQTFAVSVTMATAEYMYFDIVQVGNITPGKGITILVGYYAG